MSVATAHRPNTSAPGDGSRTITIHDVQPLLDASASGSGSGSAPKAEEDDAVGVLKLRGGPRSRPRVAWSDDVVDNEGCGKKASKSAFCPFFSCLFSSVDLCGSFQYVFFLFFVSAPPQ